MKIVVVDDEALLVKGIRFNLQNEGYQVLTGTNGLEAVELAKDPEIALMILDVMMPEMDGLTACTKIREFSQVPIIMLTAKTEDIDKLMGFDHGADDYLTKPFGVMEFVSRIRALLRRFSSKKKQISVIGNRQKIELNKDAREVFVKGEKCPLTYKEFELLQVLMSHADQVMTRDSLMELIWGVDFFGESRTLDMHIRTLRKKLGEAGSQIQTIRNVGYCFRKMEDETE